MSTVQEIENAISRLSPGDMRLVRDWLENQLEDQLQMTDEFKGRIESSERQMGAVGQAKAAASSCVRSRYESPSTLDPSLRNHRIS